MWKQTSLALACAALAATDAAAQWSQLDSESFQYKYEMDLAPDLADVDSNSILDFSLGGGGGTASDGGLSVAGGSGTYYASSRAGQTWTGSFDLATGYTIELRVKIIEDLGNDDLNVVTVAAGQYRHDADNPVDNTDDFHTLRVVRAANFDDGRWYLYRDGVLLNEDGFKARYP